MKLISLILEGFKPLSLSNIDRFEYTPENVWQLILGTNGSGKSSVLRALAPTVTDKNEFRKGGKKVSKWVTEDSSIYELTSIYKGSTQHSFIRDGEELNPGGTAKVQNELVAKHLNYDKWTHDLLTQRLAFTTMSASLREKLLLDISQIDFTYAMSVYDKCRDINRDTVGAIKHIHVKYEELTQRLAQINDVEGLAERISALEEESLRLQPLSDLSLTSVKCYQDELEASQQELTTLTGLVTRALDKAKAEGDDLAIDLDIWDGFDGFKNNIHVLTGKQETLIQETQKVQHELGDLEKIVQRIENNPETIDKETLVAGIGKAKDYLVSLKAMPVSGYAGNPSQGIDGLLLFAQELLCISEEKPSDLPHIEREEYSAAIKRIEQLRLEQNGLKEHVNRHKRHLEHNEMAKQSDVSCPKCHTVILADGRLNEEQVVALKGKITELETKVGTLENEINRLQVIDAQAKLQFGYETRLREVVRATPSIGRLINEIGNMKLCLSNPLAFRDAVMVKVDAIRRDVEILTLEKEIKDKEELLYLLSLASGDVTTRYGELQAKYDALVIEKNNCTRSIEVFSRYAKLWDGIFEKRVQLDEAIKKYCGKVIALEEKNLTLAVTERLRSIQSDLAISHKQIRQWEDLNNRKQFLESEAQSLKQRKEASELLLKGLSPKEGIIGKSLKQSLNRFCDMVNSILAEVWEHDFYIRVPEEEKVSFTFEILVNGEVRDDISKGSTGEQDMINMAVTLVVMKQKDLQGNPLFMDEVGSSFDYAHRKNLLDFIRKLITGGSISQLFMVNHFSAEYGGVSDCDMIVLNSDNIQITSSYNEVVKIN